MPSTVEAIALSVLVVVGMILLARWDKERSKTDDIGPRNLRGLAVALVCFAATAPITAAIALGLSDKPLPVRPPGNPSSCGGGSHGGEILLMVLLSIVVTRLGPALVGFFVARRRSAAKRTVVGGRRTFWVAGLCVGLAVLATVTRLLLGGYAPKDFTTYGAITPPGAKGWRARTVIDRQRGGKLRALSAGGVCKSDVKSMHSHYVNGPLEVDGLKAWIAGEPVNLVPSGSGNLAVQAVLDSRLSRARRPRFDRTPKLARAARPKDGFLLVGRQNDGSHLAVRVAIVGSSVYATGAHRAHVGLLLRPPFLPLALGLGLACLGLLLWVHTRDLRSADQKRTTRRAWGRCARLGAAVLLIEATMLLYGAYRIYF